jgi:hypothetical protein
MRWVSHFQPNRNVYQVRCFKRYRFWSLLGKRTVRILVATPAVLRFSVFFLSLLSIYLNSILNNAATASFHALPNLLFTLNYSAMWTYNLYINQQLLLITYNSWQVSKSDMFQHRGSILRDSSRLPEDSIQVQKHVAVWYLSWTARSFDGWYTVWGRQVLSTHGTSKKWVQSSSRATWREERSLES